MSNNLKHSPRRSPARLAALAAWAPAFYVFAMLPLRLTFSFSVGNFWFHYKRHALALALQALLGALLAALARRGSFQRLGGAPRAVRLAGLAAMGAGCAGWILLAAYGLDPSDLVFETAWAAALGALTLAALRPRAPWPQLALSAATCALLIIAAEGLLGARARLQARHPVPDYDNVILKYPVNSLGEAGMSRPGVNTRVRGVPGPQRWTTNRHGFRSEREFAPAPPPGRLRVMYIGDSFTLGYRSAQDRFSGAVLERALNEALTTATGGRFRQAEVMVAGAETAIMAACYLQHKGLAWRPHFVVHGICLGNDMAQAYLMTQPGSNFATEQTSAGLTIHERHDGWPGARAVEQALGLMPREAFRAGPVAPLRVLERLQTCYGLSRLGALIQTLPGLNFTPLAVSFEGDGRYRLHLFDLSHGLAFSLKAPPPLIEEAYACEARSLETLQTVCAASGSRLVAALFPQRYAVSEADWRAAVRRFALDPDRFDTDLPARRIAQACARSGIACEDLSAPLRNAGGECYLPLGDMHWNERGHEVVGQALAARILKELAGGAR